MFRYFRVMFMQTERKHMDGEVTFPLQFQLFYFVQ